MRHLAFLQPLLGIGTRAIRKADLHRRLAWLALANRFGRRPITQPGSPVVSLTTYGSRSRTVHLAIESIARGQMRPSRLLLWLDDALLMDRLPAGIKRLQKRGLEVKGCLNYGPHKKYYPYLESMNDFADLLVTADDDILYPRNWLRKLAEAYREYPDYLNCHRARVMVLEQDDFAKYDDWQLTHTTEPSLLHFLTGGAGAIFPPTIQLSLKRASTGFVSRCPRADDIWLNVHSLRAGYKVRQIAKESFRLVEIPGTQSLALSHSNVVCKENDRQIRTTYTASDVRALRDEWKDLRACP